MGVALPQAETALLLNSSDPQDKTDCLRISFCKDVVVFVPLARLPLMKLSCRHDVTGIQNHVISLYLKRLNQHLPLICESVCCIALAS